MSINILQAPALAANQTFPCPVSGNNYQSSASGIIFNVDNADINYLLGIGARTCIPRNNWSGTRAPLATDDASLLFDTGSVWVWQNAPSHPSIYVCNNGYPFAGASWSLFASSGGLGTISTENAPLRVGAGGTGLTTYGPLINQVSAKTAAYAILNTDKGKTIYVTGTDGTISIAGVGGYDPDFQVRVINNSGSGYAPLISVAAVSTFRLYPGQSVDIQSNNGANWYLTPESPQKYVNNSGAGVGLYVSNSGSDSNSGLSAGAGGAFGTIQKAIDFSHTILNNRFTTIINLELAATYAVGAGLQCNYAQNDGTQLFIFGQIGVVPGNVILSCDAGGNCVFSREPATTTLRGVSFSTTGNGAIALAVSQFATVDLDSGAAFTAFPLGAHMSAVDQASLNMLTNYQVSGSPATHMLCDHSYMNYGSFNCALPNALTFTDWVTFVNHGYVNAGGVPMTFSGTGAGAGSTGAKYIGDRLGLLSLSGATFPGASAGSLTNGAQAF